MGAFRALQRRGRRRWIEQQLDETTLILDRQANEVSLLNGSIRSISGGSDDEITDAPALDLGCTFHDSERLRCNPCLYSSGAVGFLGHRGSSLLCLSVRRYHVHVKAPTSPNRSKGQTPAAQPAGLTNEYNCGS